VGVAFGIVASVVMIVLSPPVWPGPDSQGSPSSLTFPGLVTIPIGFLGCWLGTMIGRRDSEDQYSFDELLVRSETGLGAEGGPTLERRGRRRGAPAPAREPVA
jgi:cation/acetate symporter